VRLLRRLPEQQRKVVVLRYYADQSEAATADLLGITVGAVKSAASRGLASLRAGLAAETAAPPTTADEHSEEGSRR
jgi:DNA-directed RNA polymerase specialized sigma24 family protein